MSIGSYFLIERYHWASVDSSCRHDQLVGRITMKRAWQPA